MTRPAANLPANVTPSNGHPSRSRDGKVGVATMLSSAVVAVLVVSVLFSILRRDESIRLPATSDTPASTGDSAAVASSPADDPTPARRDPASTFATALAYLVDHGGDTIRLDDFAATAEHFKTLAAVERLRVIRVEGGELNASAAAALAAMPHLEQLHLRGVAIDDAALRSLSGSQSVWLLNLAGEELRLSAAAISELGQMPRLHQLRLAIPSGDRQIAAAVADIERLRSVHLIGIAVDDEGLRSLARLPELESLYLDDAMVSDQGWLWLFDNRPGLHVHIDQRHHDRDPQSH